jgi:hypothetical protein
MTPLPPQIDGIGDLIIVRQFAETPSPLADGWQGLWFHPPTRTAVETFRSISKAAVIKLAKTPGVEQILVEDERTRGFGVR